MSMVVERLGSTFTRVMRRATHSNLNDFREAGEGISEVKAQFSCGIGLKRKTYAFPAYTEAPGTLRMTTMVYSKTNSPLTQRCDKFDQHQGDLLGALSYRTSNIFWLDAPQV